MCFLLISPGMEWWMSPSIHTSCSASTVQTTDVSNPASLHHCCSTPLVLTTQASLALSVAEMQQDFYLQSWHGSTVEMSRFKWWPWPFCRAGSVLSPLRIPANPLICSSRSKTDVKPVNFYNQPVMPQAGLLNNCGN